MHYTGEHTIKIDNKGRVSFPAAFRSAANTDDQPPSNSITVFKHPEHDALFGVETNALQAILDDPTKIGSTDALAAGAIMSFDGNGRFVLPKDIRDTFFPTAQELLMVGMGKKFEIWDPEKYDNARRQGVQNAVEELYRALD